MGYSLGIVGSRNYNDYQEFKKVIAEIIKIYGKPNKIVSGGHTSKYGKIKPGTDTLAWKYAVEYNIPITEHNAKWDKYGKAAGPIRNKKIVNDINVMIAFLANNSVGTRNSIKLAKDKKILIHIYSVLN